MDQAPPSLAAFERLAQSAIDALPPAFRAAASEVVLLVVDWPPAHLLHEMEIDDARDLTGLYEGIPLTEKSQFYQPLGPDTVWIFRADPRGMARSWRRGAARSGGACRGARIRPPFRLVRRRHRRHRPLVGVTGRTGVAGYICPASRSRSSPARI